MGVKVNMGVYLSGQSGQLTIAQDIVDSSGPDAFFYFPPGVAYDFGYEALVTSDHNQTFYTAPGLCTPILGGIEIAHRNAVVKGLYLVGNYQENVIPLYGLNFTWAGVDGDFNDPIPAGSVLSWQTPGFTRVIDCIVAGWDIGGNHAAKGGYGVKYEGSVIAGNSDKGVYLRLGNEATYADLGDIHFINGTKFYYNPVHAHLQRCGGTQFKDCFFYGQGAQYIDTGNPMPASTASGIYGGVVVEPAATGDAVQGFSMIGCNFDAGVSRGMKAVYINKGAGANSVPAELIFTGNYIKTGLEFHASDANGISIVGGNYCDMTFDSGVNGLKLMGVNQYLKEGATGSEVEQTYTITNNASTYEIIRGGATNGTLGNMHVECSGTLTLKDSSGTKTLSQL